MASAASPGLSHVVRVGRNGRQVVRNKVAAGGQGGGKWRVVRRNIIAAPQRDADGAQWFDAIEKAQDAKELRVIEKNTQEMDQKIAAIPPLDPAK